LLLDPELYASRRKCTVFRITRAEHLVAGRKRARELSEKHKARFTIDKHGRLIVPDAIPTPSHWIERAVLRGDKTQHYAIGEVNESGFRLENLELIGRTPQDRVDRRWKGEHFGWFSSWNDRDTDDACDNSNEEAEEDADNRTRYEGREVFDVCCLRSRWTWIEPDDGERVPYSRVPIGGILQVIKRGKPGNFYIAEYENGHHTPDMPSETVVIYRRADALPENLRNTIGVKEPKLPATTTKQAKPALAFESDSLFGATA
ncbi:MAG TPA: hypothetical protein VNF68_10405, partial [Candidatus Baltobacteraceae bacterium]|nr:hypothetical protein [Candidatus Baltobacteraceae bacterium]